jgi:signal transduction histidine kinase
VLANLPGMTLLAFDEELRIVFSEGPEVSSAGDGQTRLVGTHLADVLRGDISEELLRACRDAVAGEATSVAIRFGAADQVHEVDVVPLGETISGARGMIIAHDVTEREVARRGRVAMAAILRAQEDERRRIAVDLHDDAIQVMTAALFLLDSAARGREAEEDEPVRRAREMVAEAVERTRRVAFQLRPPLLVSEGLSAALPALLARSADGHVVTCHAVIGRYEDEIESLVYQTVEEVVRELRQAGGAEAIELDLRGDESRIRCRISYEGRPVVLDTSAERVRLLGGRFRMHPRAAGGREIGFTVPVG